MFEAAQTVLANALPTLYRFSSNAFSEVYGGAYSTSLSSRVIGSALVDRLKLQSRVASRRKRGRRRPNQDQMRVERSWHLWIVFFDRRWSDRIGPGIYGDDTGMIADKSDGDWFAPRAFPISSRRFKGRRCSSNERSFRTDDSVALARLKLLARFFPPGSMKM